MSPSLQRIAPFADDITQWRRELHQYPELSFEEHRTAAFVEKTLRSFGITQLRTGVAKTGIVAEIDSGRPGPSVGLRADMDALPIDEAVNCSYRSTHPGIMHACGHDAHTAMLLGAARLLKEMADAGEFPGKVRLLFQPAEETMDAEGKSGGRRMVEEGALDGLDAVFGQHVSPSIEVGKVSFQYGPITASSDRITLHVRGSSAHGAMPHNGVDAIVIAAALIQAVQQIVSRRLDARSTGLITLGTIKGGMAENIIADHVVMGGTIRAFTPEVRQTLIDELHRVCHIAKAYGGSATLELCEGYPPSINDPELTALVEKAICRELGQERIHPPIGVATGAEDFAFMSRLVRGSFLRIGVKDPAWPQPLGAHTPQFEIDERSLPIGTAALVLAATETLRCHGA